MPSRSHNLLFIWAIVVAAIIGVAIFIATTRDKATGTAVRAAAAGSLAQPGVISND